MESRQQLPTPRWELVKFLAFLMATSTACSAMLLSDPRTVTEDVARFGRLQYRLCMTLAPMRHSALRAEPFTLLYSPWWMVVKPPLDVLDSWSEKWPRLAELQSLKEELGMEVPGFPVVGSELLAHISPAPSAIWDGNKEAQGLSWRQVAVVFNGNMPSVDPCWRQHLWTMCRRSQGLYFPLMWG